MKQKTFLDLTPLLDVVLILLFAFMLNVNASTSRNDNKVNKDELIASIDEKTTQISKLENNIIELRKKVDNLNDTINEISSDNAIETETLIALSNIIADWFTTNKTSLENLAETDNINALVDKNKVLEQLHKYETISKNYFFIDIKLKSAKNKLYINGIDTKTYISREEVISAKSKNDKKETIKDLIEKVIDNRDGGYTFVLITLSEEDNVYRYAFNLLWDAIKEIQQKYGTDKIFKTKYILQN